MSIDPNTLPVEPMQRLLAIMAQLRNPDGGCSWDLEQSFETIAPYTIEEAYEVADAIQRKDIDDLRSELGDLLLQVVFHARIAEEDGLFDFNAIADTICEKMIRRHPHVFADKPYSDANEQVADWEALKAAERQNKSGTDGILDDIPLALPALKRAHKLQKRAGTVGFDWPDAKRVLSKIDEELEEVKEAIAIGNQAHIEEEIGDLLFVCCNLARKSNIDSETALIVANRKFERRFRFIEETLKQQGRDIKQASLEEMEALWLEAKSQEKQD